MKKMIKNLIEDERKGKVKKPMHIRIPKGTLHFCGANYDHHDAFFAL